MRDTGFVWTAKKVRLWWKIVEEYVHVPHFFHRLNYWLLWKGRTFSSFMAYAQMPHIQEADMHSWNMHPDLKI